MYKDFSDPWEQTKKEKTSTDKLLAIEIFQKYSVKRVLELGCGLGMFTNMIHSRGFEVCGIDISKNAIDKAKMINPNILYYVGNILDADIIESFNPDVIVMAEVTWYVLDQLADFKMMLKNRFTNVLFMHLLTTYPQGVQKYGKEFFTNNYEIMDYFGMDYLEWGIINSKDMNEHSRTYFLGRQF